jgi:2-deoxy-D-gluconate 3-dehydrogenase
MNVLSPQKYIPISKLIDLNGRGAIVTGGASGIGFAVCLAGRACQELRDNGYVADSCTADVSREEEVRDMVSAAVTKLGSIDILVNSAGIYPRIPLEKMTGDDFERVVSINLTGTFLCGREVSQRMVAARKGGSIINIASIDAVHPSADGMLAYDASKGGVVSLTRSLALELGRHDIRVNVIAPGGILTEGFQACLAGQSVDKGRTQLKSFMARMPLGRLGRADDIGRVALFLASDLAEYMTGSLLVVDGGYLIT